MTVVIHARGHPSVTATHAKTFEISTDDDIGREATCVVAVGARADWDALGRLIGPATITLEAGGHKAVVRAVVSPFWHRGHGLVVRKSGFRSDDTLAIDADGAAADLDRALVAALASGAEATITVRPLGDPPSVVLFTDRLERRVPDGVRVVGVPFGPVELSDEEVLARPGAAIAAAQAVAGLAGEVLVLGPLAKGKRAREEQLAAARAKAPAVGVVTAGAAVDEAAASAVFRPGEVVAPVVAGPPAERLNTEDRVFSVLAGDPVGDGQVGALLDALREEGVSARALRQAVGRVPGLGRFR